MDWKDYFKQPFSSPSIDMAEYVFDADSRLVLEGSILDSSSLNIMDFPARLITDVVALVNGVKTDAAMRCVAEDLKKVTSVSYVGDNGDSYVNIVYNGLICNILIRGWGYLTGPCDLSPKTAAEIQDSLGTHIVELIRNTIKNEGKLQ